MQPCIKQDRLIEHGRIEDISLNTGAGLDINQWGNVVPPIDAATPPFFAFYRQGVRPIRVGETEYLVRGIVVFVINDVAHFVRTGIATVLAVLEGNAIVNSVWAGQGATLMGDIIEHQLSSGHVRNNIGEAG